MTRWWSSGTAMRIVGTDELRRAPQHRLHPHTAPVRRRPAARKVRVRLAPRQEITPTRRATATAWVRLWVSSLVLMLRRCVRMVLSETNSFSAIALLE